MAKSLLYRLFGAGRIAPPMLAQLNSEGLLLLDDGLKASVTYRNFKAPGKRDAWRRKCFAGSIALTQTRLLALSGSNPIINVPLTDPRLKEMHFTLEKEGQRLCIAFAASLFHNDWSGTIEYRFRTSEAQRLLSLLQEQMF